MTDRFVENTKVKNLLKKLVENKDFEFSFVYDDFNGHTEEYTFFYTVKVGNVLGFGSSAVARVEVIIDNILMDDDDFYYDWVESDYSEFAWYLDYLSQHLREEIFDVFPFPTYITYYGYDEDRELK